MTQSKKNNHSSIEDQIIIDLSKEISDAIDNDIIISLNDTYGATTTYLADGLVSDTITISGTGASYDEYNVSWSFKDNRIDPEDVERMCKEYPGLEKAWSKFKSFYDMCKQDYEGKRKAGELDE